MKRVFADGNILFSIFISLFFNGVIWVLLWLKTSGVVIPITLHYNVHWGADVVGDVKEVFIFPFVGLSLLAINLLLGYFFYESGHKAIAYFLTGFVPLLQIILLIVSFSLVALNF